MEGAGARGGEERGENCFSFPSLSDPLSLPGQKQTHKQILINTSYKGRKEGREGQINRMKTYPKEQCSVFACTRQGQSE